MTEKKKEANPVQDRIMERIGKYVNLKNYNNEKWFMLLGEKIGWVADICLETVPDKDSEDGLNYELIQVAAICVSWLLDQEKKSFPFKEEE